MWENFLELYNRIQPADRLAIATIVLIITVFWMNRERRRLNRDLTFHLGALKQQLLAIREEVESIPSPANGTENWAAVRNKWAEARERIELRIENLDGRVRRKYGRIPRYSYTEVINQLKEDEAIDEQTANALLEMNRAFAQVRRNPAAVSTQRVQDFAVLLDRATKGLPTLE